MRYLLDVLSSPITLTHAILALLIFLVNISLLVFIYAFISASEHILLDRVLFFFFCIMHDTSSLA